MTDELNEYHRYVDEEDAAAIERGRVRLRRVSPSLIEDAARADRGLIVEDDEGRTVAYIAPYPEGAGYITFSFPAEEDATGE